MIMWLNPDGQFRRSDPPFDELAPLFRLTLGGLATILHRDQ
jgi:hypothetical protein